MKLSVLIGTCDLYSPLWESFQICFDRYWKFNTQNLFIGETIRVPNYTNTKFETILQGKTVSAGMNNWGERMRQGIEACEEDYIFFILEDYFLDYTYSEEQMNDWLDAMKKYDMNRIQISGPLTPQFDVSDTEVGCPYNKYTLNSRYIISVQPSIWKKSFLLETLKSEYSPWDFEIKGSKLLIGTDHRTFADITVMDTRKYFNAVRIGFKKSVGWEKFRMKEKLKDF